MRGLCGLHAWGTVCIVRVQAGTAVGTETAGTGLCMAANGRPLVLLTTVGAEGVLALRQWGSGAWHASEFAQGAAPDPLLPRRQLATFNGACVLGCERKILVGCKWFGRGGVR